MQFKLDNDGYAILPKKPTDVIFDDSKSITDWVQLCNECRKYNLNKAYNDNNKYMYIANTGALGDYEIDEKKHITVNNIINEIWDRTLMSDWFNATFNEFINTNWANNITKYTTKEDFLTDFENYQKENNKDGKDIATYSIAISEQMKKLKKDLDWLITNFNNNRPIYSIYLKFDVGNQTLVDTSSLEPEKNCLLSFDHKFTGTGHANQFTLKIAFKPTERTSWVINYIDKILIGACDVTTANGDENASHSELKDEKDVSISCTYKYGYGGNNGRTGVTYSGMILGFNTDLSNGYFIYTITGIAGIYSTKERKLSAKPEYLKDEKGDKITNPLLYIKRIVDIEFNNDNDDEQLFTVKFLNDCDGDVTGDDTVTEANSITVENYNEFQQKTIFQIINDILNALVVPSEQKYFTAGGNQVLVPSAKTTYGFYVTSDSESDNNGKASTIVIYKTPNINSKDDKNIKPHIDLSFNWYMPQGGVDHLIMSWNPKFEGIILMALASSIKSKAKDLTAHTIDNDGNVIKVISFEAPRIGGDQTATTGNRCQEFSQWSKSTQYPYEAELKILGCPSEVPMTGIINVKAWIYDQEHHSSGNYMILGKSDSISGSGFFTTLKLFKITPGYDEIISVNLDGKKSGEETHNVGNTKFSDKYKLLYDIQSGEKTEENITFDELKAATEKLFAMKQNKGRYNGYDYETINSFEKSLDNLFYKCSNKLQHSETNVRAEFFKIKLNYEMLVNNFGIFDGRFAVYTALEENINNTTHLDIIMQNYSITGNFNNYNSAAINLIMDGYLDQDLWDNKVNNFKNKYGLK